ncbi:ras gtpase-activating protein [Anaeramoeba flamelloides]|uniref:Ras gtpase-activating protein n=1 Tax=Anaeramoeba flamelloides TaxID=1746091 RepID=A0ABQ8XCI2_9EUKA|nr:ras gtpase-activating protein [Anaeramoeba flamelloides]
MSNNNTITFLNKHIFGSAKVYRSICLELLENKELVVALSVTADSRDFESIANSLLGVGLTTNSVLQFINILIKNEFYRLYQKGTILRTNSINTYLCTVYTRYICMDYLRFHLGGVIHGLLSDTSLDFEVDSYMIENRKYFNKSTDNSSKILESNQISLISCCQIIFEKILFTKNELPDEIKIICHYIADCAKVYKINRVANLIGGYIFLRFFNSILINPKRYGLLPKESKETKESRRNMILVTKLLQNLSNGLYFSNIEYLKYFNNWIKENLERMKGYLMNVSKEGGESLNSKLKFQELKEFNDKYKKIEIVTNNKSNISEEMEREKEKEIEKEKDKDKEILNDEKENIEKRRNEKDKKVKRKVEEGLKGEKKKENKTKDGIGKKKKFKKESGKQENDKDKKEKKQREGEVVKEGRGKEQNESKITKEKTKRQRREILEFDIHSIDIGDLLLLHRFFLNLKEPILQVLKKPKGEIHNILIHKKKYEKFFEMLEEIGPPIQHLQGDMDKLLLLSQDIFEAKDKGNYFMMMGSKYNNKTIQLVYVNFREIALLDFNNIDAIIKEIIGVIAEIGENKFTLLFDLSHLNVLFNLQDSIRIILKKLKSKIKKNVLNQIHDLIFWYPTPFCKIVERQLIPNLSQNLRKKIKIYHGYHQLFQISQKNRIINDIPLLSFKMCPNIYQINLINVLFENEKELEKEKGQHYIKFSNFRILIIHRKNQNIVKKLNLSNIQKIEIFEDLQEIKIYSFKLLHKNDKQVNRNKKIIINDNKKNQVIEKQKEKRKLSINDKMKFKMKNFLKNINDTLNPNEHKNNNEIVNMMGEGNRDVNKGEGEEIEIEIEKEKEKENEIFNDEKENEKNKRKEIEEMHFKFDEKFERYFFLKDLLNHGFFYDLIYSEKNEKNIKFEKKEMCEISSEEYITHIKKITNLLEISEKGIIESVNYELDSSKIILGFESLLIVSKNGKIKSEISYGLIEEGFEIKNLQRKTVALLFRRINEESLIQVQTERILDLKSNFEKMVNLYWGKQFPDRKNLQWGTLFSQY